MALAFVSLFPELKISADIDNRDKTTNHAWVHDGVRSHDWKGSHSSPNSPSGLFRGDYDTPNDLDPMVLAKEFGYSWTPEYPWVDSIVCDAAEVILSNWALEDKDKDA